MSLGALASVIDDALVEIDSLLVDTDGNYSTFTWRPDTGPIAVKCVQNMAVRGSVVVIGGREVTVQFSLNVRLAHFLTVDSTLITVDSELYTADNDTPRPVAGMFLTCRGRSYRVASAAIDPTGTYVNLVCSDRQSAR